MNTLRYRRLLPRLASVWTLVALAALLLLAPLSPADAAGKKGAAAKKGAPAETTETKAAADEKTDATEDAAATGKAGAADASAWPDAKALLDDSFKKYGSTRFTTAKRWYAKGQFEMPQAGLAGTIELWAARPKLAHSRATLPGVGVLEEGFDGTRGWSTNAMEGPRLKAGDEALEAAFDAVFDSAGRTDIYEKLENLGPVDFNGKKAWKLRAVPMGGAAVRVIYLEVATGLEIGGEVTLPTAMGPVPVVAKLTEHAEMDGVTYPKTMVSEMMGMTQIIKIDDMSFDGDEHDFTPPADVQALIAEADKATEAVTK